MTPRSLRRAAAAAALVAGIVALAGGGAWAFDRTNIPLKNWGGFAVFRDEVYDDLERLVTAGLAGQAILNTKPLSRVEAARLVARAIETIRRDDDGRLNRRRDLEPVLDRLIAEFRPELAQLGVRINGEETPPGWFSFTPVDRAQVRMAIASDEMRPVNAQGLKLHDVFNAGATFESRAQVGDFLSLYLQPEVVGNQEYGRLRVATGTLKLTLFNVELSVGREPLWWGPALHGSLVLSNNAAPLDQLRLQSAEPFRIPLVSRLTGPLKALFFVAQLEENRPDDPRARLAGMRVTMAPTSFLELGISRVMMFGGENQPRPDVVDFFELIFSPPAGDRNRSANAQRSNNIFAIDGDLRLRNVDRYMLPARDMRIYGEFGWDDTCCSSAFVPLADAISYIVGVQFFGMFGQEGLDSRFEYSSSSRLSFIHDQFDQGYWTRGSVISHVIGRAGEEFFSRVTNRLRPNVMLGLELERRTSHGTPRPERKIEESVVGGAIDLSYRFARDYTLFGQYRLRHVDNRNFDRSEDGIDHLFLLELTRSF
jgi:hypothetical protein